MRSALPAKSRRFRVTSSSLCASGRPAKLAEPRWNARAWGAGQSRMPAIRARNEENGLALNARTTMPSWLGERLDVGYAIDVLHPMARQR